MKALAVSLVSSIALITVSGCAQVEGLFGGGEQAAGPVSTAQTSSASVLAPQDMIGKSVITTAGQDLGKVDDVLMTRSGKPSSVVISSGSFMGIGGRQVAMDLDQLRYSSQRNALVAPNMTENEFASLPEYTSTNDMVSLKKSQ